MKVTQKEKIFTPVMIELETEEELIILKNMLRFFANSEFNVEKYSQLSISPVAKEFSEQALKLLEQRGIK